MKAVAFDSDRYGFLLYLIDTNEKIMVFKDARWDDYSVVRVDAKAISLRPGETATNVDWTIVANGPENQCRAILREIGEALGAF